MTSGRWALRLGLVALGGAGLALTGGCGPTEPGLDRARATIEELAGTIGTRPIGSPEADRARDYVVAALGQAGFEVRLQEADAVWPAAGATTHVSNVIAVRRGTDAAAIALVSHYDSVPDGPGAQDDALGVATCLESARQLAARALTHTLMVLVTDGEEVGLMGARAVVTDPEVHDHVRAFLNFDGTGGTGPPVLFQAGPGRGDTLRAWARGAAAPFGGSFGVEIYKRLPNDTDFTILAASGASGLNFAPVGDSYVYHTDRDRPAGVSDATIAREIANTVGIVRALDGTALGRVDDDPTFFDLAQTDGLVYGRMPARLLGILALVLGLVAWALLTRHLLADPARALGRAALGALLVVIVALVSMTAAVGILQAVRHEPTPWYAAPVWAFGALAAIGCLEVWAGGRLKYSVAGSLPSYRPSPALLWWMALPVWMLLGAFLLVTAQAASYLVTIPLVLVSLGVVLSTEEPWLRLLSAAVAVVVWILWAANILVLLGFLVPLFGWLPVRAPMWLYPAVLGVAGLLLLPPVVAIGAGSSTIERRARWIGGFWVALAVVCLIGAVRAPVYTADRPARRSVRYVQDDVHQTAWWAIAGSDAALETPPTEPAGSAWTAGDDGVPPTVRAGLFQHPLRLSTPSGVIAAPRAAIASTLDRTPDGHVTLHVMVTPHALATARLVLPPGVRPTSTNLAGATQRGQWSATVVAVHDPIEFRVDLATDISEGALADAVVEITVAGCPAESAMAGSLPAWLPPGPASWQARSVFIESARPGGG